MKVLIYRDDFSIQSLGDGLNQAVTQFAIPSCPPDAFRPSLRLSPILRLDIFIQDLKGLKKSGKQFHCHQIAFGGKKSAFSFANTVYTSDAVPHTQFSQEINSFQWPDELSIYQ